MKVIKRLLGRNNRWPTAIVAYFIVFISFLVVFVAFASRQQVELVRKDYYAEEILFQKQIDQRARAAQFREHVFVTYDQPRSIVKVAVPRSEAGQGLAGSVAFYRPSDSRLDREFKLNLNGDGVQEIGVGSFPKGLWKVRLRWTTGGAEYGHDETLVLGL